MARLKLPFLQKIENSITLSPTVLHVAHWDDHTRQNAENLM